MYKVLSQGASKLPQVLDLELQFYLITTDIFAFLELFTFTFGKSDAPLGKTPHIT